MCDQQLDVATVEAEPEPKSITNIYYDCLERIFDFLDLESLMNVAGTCKRLRIAAAAKYADDYGHTSVNLRDDGHENNIISRGTYISVRGLKFCLTFLRCFGAKILNLVLGSMLRTRNGHRYVGRYINQYCADKLISIHFYCGSSFSSEIFIKPFKSVKKLTLHDSNLGDQLPNFVELLPNLHQLTLFGKMSIDDNAIAVSFPHLEHLTLLINESGPGLFSTESATKFLHANQQLQSLEIGLTAKFDNLLDVISANKSILKLRVHGSFFDMSDVELNNFANEHPLLEELCLAYFIFDVDDAISLTRQLNSLKLFQFRVEHQTECYRFLSQLDSIWKHRITPLPHFISVIIWRE